ncbi:MAG: lycopene cyclase family protein [Pseudonocardiales bacterium]|nr:lycopene cyclase family protein [Actinomycetota bacterium]PZS19781.1 MAG: lycopene cyclase family protein [Pseudonocardiales bacterium]
MIDVLVAGGGPAGWAVAAACARLGLDTELADPAPDRPWRATYGSWRRELPTDAAPAVAASGSGDAIGTTGHRLGWDYVILDNAVLRDGFAAAPVKVVKGRVRAARPDPDGVTVDFDGGQRRAAVLLDATGAPRSVLGASPRRIAAEQTAVGVLVDADAARDLVTPGSALFMDWRPHHGETGWPTFLYAVPVTSDRVLLEETSLARRPGFELGVLRRRLHARLGHHGIAVPPGAEERVRFPVDLPLPAPGDWRGPVIPFGAASPLVHPATGYSVATSLRLAPRVATAIRDALARGGSAAAGAAAWQTVWSPAALAVHTLRRRSLESLLRFPPRLVPEFFDVFFALPERHRWTYLTGREDVAGSAAAMGALFAASPWWLRKRLVLGALDARTSTHSVTG